MVDLICALWRHPRIPENTTFVSFMLLERYNLLFIPVETASHTDSISQHLLYHHLSSLVSQFIEEILHYILIEIPECASYFTFLLDVLFAFT